MDLHRATGDSSSQNKLKVHSHAHTHTHTLFVSHTQIYLRAMDGKTWCSVELLVANVALEMFGLLVVDEHLVIIKLSVAIPSHTTVKRNTGGGVFYLVHTATTHLPTTAGSNLVVRKARVIRQQISPVI